MKSKQFMAESNSEVKLIISGFSPLKHYFDHEDEISEKAMAAIEKKLKGRIPLGCK